MVGACLLSSLCDTISILMECNAYGDSIPGNRKQLCFDLIIQLSSCRQLIFFVHCHSNGLSVYIISHFYKQNLLFYLFHHTTQDQPLLGFFLSLNCGIGVYFIFLCLPILHAIHCIIRAGFPAAEFKVAHNLYTVYT